MIVTFREFRDNRPIVYGSALTVNQQEMAVEELLQPSDSRSLSRVEFWIQFIQRLQIRKMVEVGVYQGDFAAALLQHCSSLDAYYMLDPWRHLPDWNKPANQDDVVFNQFFESTKRKTDFAGDRRKILRGTTTEMIHLIPDASLDFAYIDGDHTLRGITIDLLAVYSKVKPGGFIGGDDFTPTIWQHKTNYEPTLVYPFALYFAEAVGAKIYALPNCQFCLKKGTTAGFSFVDLTGKYAERTLQGNLAPERLLKLWFREKFPRVTGLASKVRRSVVG